MKGTMNVTRALTSDLNSFDVDDASTNAVLNWQTVFFDKMFPIFQCNEVQMEITSQK